MRTRLFICVAIIIAAAAGVGGFATTASAATAATAKEFKTVYAKAMAANKEAAALQNEWSYTVKALKAAKKAAAAGDYDKALKEARHAQGMADVSVEQAKQQAKIWRQAVVR